MHKIFFLLLLVFKYTIAQEEESNEKYIDLLPEEEKQEFLNKIARRILADIKSGDTPNESQAVITDDQLDAHDAYVKEILKEESEKLKSDKRREELENEEEYNKQESSSGNKDEHIDLTLREGRRQKRNNSRNSSKTENIAESPFYVIPVKTVYDQYENNDEITTITESVLIPVKDNLNIISEHEMNIANETSKINSSDVEIVTTIANVGLSDDYFNETDKQGNLRKSYYNKIRTTGITNFEPDSNERSYTTDSSNISDYAPASAPVESINYTTSDQGTWGSTEKNYIEGSSDEKGNLYVKETTQVYENKSDNKIVQTESSEIITPTVNVTEKMTALVTSNVSNSNLTSNFHKISFRSGIEPENNSYEDLYIRKSITEIGLQETFTPNSTPFVEITGNTQFTVKDSFHVTEKTSILSNTTREISEDAKEVESYTENNISNAVPTHNTSILRARPDSEVIEINDNASIENLHANSVTVKPYEVYEVDAVGPHFANSGKKLDNGQPFYVPVYNYTPDNAYFKPYNKYGPNIEDFKNSSTENDIPLYSRDNIHSDLINGRNSFFGYNNQNKPGWHKDMKTINNPSNKQSLKLLELMKPMTHKLINQKIFYNPYDYPDMDYFARILRRGRDDYDVRDENDFDVKHFPDSNEPEHSLSSIHQSDTIKDHVRAIRNILYLQKIFGFVPYVNGRDKIVRKANQYYKTKKTSKKLTNNNIDIDYYFDRTGSNEQGAYNRVFNVSRIKQRNSNITPLTPNPIIFGPILKNEKNIRRDKSKYQHFNGPLFSNIFEAMLIVLNDSIKSENKNLVEYDWLTTTVNIQAASRKLLDLIGRIKNGRFVHPKDIELLKYSLYIFKSSQISLEGKPNKRVITEVQSISKSKNRILPKTKRKDKVKEPLKFWKHFVYLRRKQPTELRVTQRGKLLYDFEEFLQSLLFYLFDLHDSIKHIAMITKYKKQRWFRDLKDIYLGHSNRKLLAQVLLHLSLSKLLDCVEESSTNGVEENFRLYVKNNGEVVKRTVEEAIFVVNVLQELQRINVSE